MAVFIGPGDLSLTRGRGLNRTPRPTRRTTDASSRRSGRPARRGAWRPATPRRRRFAMDLGAAFITTTDDLSAVRAGLATDLAISY